MSPLLRKGMGQPETGSYQGTRFSRAVSFGLGSGLWVAALQIRSNGIYGREWSL
ncbi:MAG TPA: hypothetical protein VN872_05615 [Candidatus Acidoferrum sp.]|nr:hypothetical protein [Candidatus Acidoferrum sp.]